MLSGLGDPFTFLIFIISLLFALSVHEAAHAWASNQLGDPTAKFAGRLTLNPLAHLDPIGTLLFLLFGFGWGKPVPVDEFNLNNPRRDVALISLSGPAANFLSASVISLLLWLTSQSGINNLVISRLSLGIIQLNIILGVFNLLPVYPLDGSKILVGFLPSRAAQNTDHFLKQYGILILIALFLPIFAGKSLINLTIAPLVNLIINKLLFWLA
jgi:Zn-dependent protease